MAYPVAGCGRIQPPRGLIVAETLLEVGEDCVDCLEAQAPEPREAERAQCPYDVTIETKFSEFCLYLLLGLTYREGFTDLIQVVVPDQLVEAGSEVGKRSSDGVERLGLKSVAFSAFSISSR